MKAKTWIFLAIGGIILVVIGIALTQIIVWSSGPFGIPMPSAPFAMVGIALAAIGGVLTSISILAFIIGYSKESAKEVISEGIRTWKEKETPPPPPPPGTQVCPTCGGPLTYIEQYQRWYCYKCKKYT